MMLSLEIFRYNLSTFSVSTMTFFQSWFLRTDKVVFLQSRFSLSTLHLFVFLCKLSYCDVRVCGILVFIILHFNLIRGFLHLAFQFDKGVLAFCVSIQ